MQIYIIDDEPKIRRGIANAIKLYKPEYPQPLTACSAEEALQDPAFIQAELLFLDIQLPGKSGLELLENIRQRDLNLSVIIISGYAEFSFAQKALSLNVVDYLLKPIDLNKLLLLIDRVEKEQEKSSLISIRELRLQREKLFKDHLFMEDGISDDGFIRFLSGKGMKDSSFFLVNLKQSINNASTIAETVRSFNRSLNSLDVFDSNSVDSLHLIEKNFAVLFFISSPEYLSNLLQAINASAGETNLPFTCSSIYQSFSFIKDALTESEEKVLLSHDLTRYIETIISSKSSYHLSVENTIVYITEHYKEQITLALIADEVHLHQSYLSNLFKKETGKGLSNFITDYRLYIAKALLSNTRERISSISESVGFLEYPYFSQVFSKRVGMTPQKYRAMHKKAD